MPVANFPALRPSARSWTPGQRPSSAYASLSGYEVRVLHGSRAVGQQLELSFTNLDEADVLTVTDHWELARGTFELFDLPTAVFAGMSGASKVKPTGNLWRYNRAPSVSYVAPGIASVTVSLIAVPS